jgi:hypothetical protein
VQLLLSNLRDSAVSVTANLDEKRDSYFETAGSQNNEDDQLEIKVLSTIRPYGSIVVLMFKVIGFHFTR